MAHNEVLYVDNDNLIELRGLKNAATDMFENAATVAVTLKDAGGTNIVGETWPLAMGYVTGSDGDYRATAADTLTITAGEMLTAIVDADAGTGLKGKWETPVRAITRK